MSGGDLSVSERRLPAGHSHYLDAGIVGGVYLSDGYPQATASTVDGRVYEECI